MIIACDFFVSGKEAISNQMELLRESSDSIILGAVRFMNQKSLKASDLRKKRIIVGDKVYRVILRYLPVIMNQGVHYFEEEGSESIRKILNATKAPILITMYRRPTKEYADHLLKLNNLQTVFVELDEHKRLLEKFGIPSNIVKKFSPPSIFEPSNNTKVFDPERITLIYASWNMGEPEAFEKRGLRFLLDLLKANKNLFLVIPLRDNLIEEFITEAKKRKVENRVSLQNLKSRVELRKMFEFADFVVFCPTEKISKDVPNSIVDGLVLGKPCIVSKHIDFQKEINSHKLGFVIDPLSIFKISITKKCYERLSRNAARYGQNFSRQNYLKILRHYK